MQAAIAIFVVAWSLLSGLLVLDPAKCLADEFYLHTTTSNVINNSAPTATTAKSKDSSAVNRSTYQEIGTWSALPFSSAVQIQSLSELHVWIGLKNSDDQGTYFDLKAEIMKNGSAIASGETKNIQGVTRNANLAKEVTVSFAAIVDGNFVPGDVLSIRILTKVADSGGHNNAVGLRLYYDAVSRPSRFGANFGSSPGKLVVMSVNGGTNPVAGVGFPVVVQSQTASGTPANVTSATAVSLSLKTGSGTLGGNLTGTIVAGTSQVTITGVTYNKAENGVVLTATRTSGDHLTTGESAPFTVDPVSTAVSLAAVPNTVAAGDPFTVTWAQIPNPNNRDWIGLFTPGSADTAYLDYIYVGCAQVPTLPAQSGACSFPIVAHRVPGIYEFRLFPNNTFERLATSDPVTIDPPSNLNKLALLVSPTVTAGTPGFYMTVQAKTPSGELANVTSDTSVAVSLTLGNGVLGGTLTGTISAGTNETTVGLATYTKAQSSVVLTASRTSGDQLTAGASLPFTVIPGPPARLAFTTQPGGAAVNSTIPGPPTVTVTDNAGNAVTSFNGSIGIALGSNPGGGTLDGNLTVTAGPSISYPALSVNQPGNGYTLTASSVSLEGATSNPFNITMPAGGGTVSGFVTRVSNGMAISGAVVEVFQDNALRGMDTTGALGNYAITGLAAGNYTVRASYTGLVPQVVNNVSVADGGTSNVDLSLNFGIAIQSPVAGATVNDSSVLVTGNFDTSLAPEVGITVNGYGALIDGDEFTALVPVVPTVTVITAAVKNFAGTTLASDMIPVTIVASATETVVRLIPSPPGGLAPLTVGFLLSTSAPVSQITLDLDGNGSIDFQGASLTGNLFTYNQPGVYTPTVQITDSQGQTHTAVTFVQVLEQAALDAQLQVVWQGFKNALRAGEISQAVTFLHSGSRAAYQAKLAQFSATTLANIDQYMTSIQLVNVGFGGAQYEMIRIQNGQQVSFSVWFLIDQDGIWRLRRF